KRHNFAGSPASHGHKDQLRMPGSIGALGPQRVFKGVKMAGRTGGDRVTVKNLKIMKVDPEKNIIAVKGAIPGSRGAYVSIKATDGNIWHK
ncbi:50S ribosomal protein L3, partial [Candidatus Parcubacteria bacterium]